MLYNDTVIFDVDVERGRMFEAISMVTLIRF
jgi:hypothetical protein